MSDSNFSSVAFLLLPKATGAVPATDRCGNTLTAVDNAALSADGSALSGYSLALDGSGDWVSTAGAAALNFGSGNFTIDFRFNCTGTTKAILEYVDASSIGWRLWVSSTGYLEFYSNSTLLKVGSTLVNNGAKHHCAIVRNGTALMMYVDGVAQGGSITDSTAYSTTPPILSIGARVTSRNPGLDMPGNFDFVRITPGVSRWTAGFTPPTLADLAPQYAVLNAESFGLAGIVERSAKYPSDVSELSYFSGYGAGASHGLASESINVSSSASMAMRASAIAAESISVASSVATKAAKGVVASESMSIFGSASSNAKLSAGINDGMSFFEAEAIYASLDELVSVWVANVATAAHSRYAQYGFNSFAKFNGKYYGCKSDGIYELDGDSDGASPIKWTVTMPELDFGTSNLKRFESVYVGMRSSGQIVLKVVQDKNNVYHYDVIPSGNDARASRAILGRGLVGRYWQFELASDTNRVELDSIDYSLAVTSRRV